MTEEEKQTAVDDFFRSLSAGEVLRLYDLLSTKAQDLNPGKVIKRRPSGYNGPLPGLKPSTVRAVAGRKTG